MLVSKFDIIFNSFLNSPSYVKPILSIHAWSSSPWGFKNIILHLDALIQALEGPVLPLLQWIYCTTMSGVSRYLVLKVVDMSRWMNAYELMDDVNHNFYKIPSKWSVSKDTHRYYSYYVWYLVNCTASQTGQSWDTRHGQEDSS